jgi:hypothetical protein
MKVFARKYILDFKLILISFRIDAKLHSKLFHDDSDTVEGGVEASDAS